MAVDNAQGFQFYKSKSGQVAPRRLEIAVDSSNGSAIFPGDPIQRESDGNAAASGNAGVILGIADILMDSDKNVISAGFLTTTTAGFVGYIPAEGNLFLLQEDSDSATIADSGLNFDTIAGSGTTNPPTSKYEINSDSGTDSSAQIRVVGLNESTLLANRQGSNMNWVVEVIETQGVI